MERDTQNLQVSADTDSYGMPSSFDWRNVGGYDYTTPVKDQGDCGSCWAFAAMGSLESVVNIVKQDPNYNIDLSEQYLVSCCPSMGNVPNNCNGGNGAAAINWMAGNEGALYEDCFPYEARNSDCELSCNYYITIGGARSAGGSIEYTKKQLLKCGPLLTSFQVYDDFDDYENGVYRVKWNSEFTGISHQVLLVGYQDVERSVLQPYDGYWICKNSWGTGWGETKSGEENSGRNGGWFRIAYGECGIDNYEKYAVSYSDSSAPKPKLTVSTDKIIFSKRTDSKKTFTITNTGESGSKLMWFLKAYSGYGWIDSVSPQKGVLNKGESAKVTVKIDWYKGLRGELEVHAFGPDIEEQDILLVSPDVKNLIYFQPMFKQILSRFFFLLDL